jgi:hypothetical protein
MAKSIKFESTSGYRAVISGKACWVEDEDGHEAVQGLLTNDVRDADSFE